MGNIKAMKFRTIYLCQEHRFCQLEAAVSLKFNEYNWLLGNIPCQFI